MKAYLTVIGAIVITLSVIGGAVYLSGNYEQYQRKLQNLGAPKGSPMTIMDEAKWQFAVTIGTGLLAGGVILGSMLIGLGWIGKTLEEIRNAMVEEPSEPQESA